MKRQRTEIRVSDIEAGNRSAAIQAIETVPQEKFLTAFSNELNPIDPIERFLVEELSRRAAQTRDYDAAQRALRREGEVALLGVLSTSDNNSVPARSLAHASVLGSERHETLMRQGVASARGFLRALHALREYRGTYREIGPGSLLLPDPRFSTEQGCLAHLVRRYFHGRCACRRCGAISTSSFVTARSAWQCASCHAQTGLRCGTCMERSALPLTKWFAAIKITLLSPTTATEELATVLKIDRRQTVRKMIDRIRAAVNSQDPSAALAGLDQLYLGFG